MLSEGTLRTKAIGRGLDSYSKAAGVSLEELEEIAYLLLAGLILVREARIDAYLPGAEAARLEALISDVLEVGDPDTTEDQLHELKALLSMAMECEWRGAERSAGVLALAIRHIAGMLMYELSEVDRNVQKHVLDALFYKLYARYAPLEQRHHQLVAAYALPLAQSVGGVSELQPGPGEIFTLSGMPEGRDSHFNQHPKEIPHGLNERLRFLRNLRLASHALAFEGREAKQRISTLWVLDNGVEIPMRAYGEMSVMVLNTHRIEHITEFLRAGHPPTLAVLKGKDRRQRKIHQELRTELVKHHNLRAVIDFTSSTTKTRKADCSLLYFGPAFPDYPDRIALIDARQLRPDLQTNEALTCATLVGTLLRTWIEGRSPSKETLEETGAPRRVINFIENGLPLAYPEIPGFVRFVTANQMQRQHYSFLTEDYVERVENRGWHPEVEIGPILSGLHAGNRHRAVYLIGDNGAGKSLALRDVATALAREGRQSFGISFGATDRFDRTPRLETLKSNFTYAGARTFDSGPNMRRALGELGDMANRIFDEPDRLACLESALDRLGFKPRQFLVPVAMDSTSDPREKMLADIHPLSARADTHRQREEIQRRRQLPKGAYKIAVLRNDSQEIVTFDALSSGEQQILTMVIKIVANVQRDVTVLLDEPELSLHVAWQRLLPKILGDFSRVLGCAFVVATHSPVLIASTDDSGDLCFVMHKHRLTELPPAQRRSVEASLFEGFRTYTPYTHHVQERCAAIIGSMIGDADDHGRVTNADNPFLRELKSLRSHLGDSQDESAANDRRLIDKAISAVHEILTP